LAGDKKLYDKAVQAGLNFAWDGRWERALEEYQRAQAEIPDDPVVYNHLGLANLQLERPEAALEAFSIAHALAPDDPAPLMRLVEIYSRQGQPDAAATASFSLATIFRERENWAEAIKALQDTIQFQPDHGASRLALAEVFVKLRQPQRAGREYLNLARLLQRQGRIGPALEQCRRAIEVDPLNAEALALARGLDLQPREGVVAERSRYLADDKAAEPGSSPADIARVKALEELASIPFEDTMLGPEPRTAPNTADAQERSGTSSPGLSRSEVNALIAQAIDFQTRGLLDEAIASYTRVVDAGLDRAAAHFNLGLLYQRRLGFESAIQEFGKAVDHPQYSLGSHFALGECFRAVGRVDDALQHFLHVLKVVDMGIVRDDQADELIQLYDALADSYVAKGDRERATSFADSLAEFLSSKGWEDKARAVRQRIDSCSDEDVPLSLAEFVAAPNADALLTAMSSSREYMKRDALTAATEVCYQAIQSAPAYLPMHLRLAEVFCQEKRIDDAASKYRSVADLYVVRGEAWHAIDVYNRLLRLEPMDVAARSRLIDLLIDAGQIDQALEQYLALADAHYQLAQADEALDKYSEALRLARRASSEKDWRVRLLHGMGDLQTRRLHWQEALEVYAQLVDEAPDDERARLQLIDLNHKLGRPKQAEQEVEAMLAYYRARDQADRSFVLLQEAVRLQPKQMALRARLATMYLDAGKQEEAVAELDALGELQIERGLKEQAIRTVKFIISLKPKNVEEYQQLLSQL
jgi:tetratricopeptide (TPR) repeat protein